MNRKAVKKWRNALRSGKYKQTSGCCYNSTSDAYCVLGVCNKVVGKDKLRDIQERYSLSENTVEKLGVEQRFPLFLGINMSALNDNGTHPDYSSLTFDELADLLDIALLEKNENYIW